MKEEKIKIRTIFNDAKKLIGALENYFGILHLLAIIYIHFHFWKL